MAWSGSAFFDALLVLRDGPVLMMPVDGKSVPMPQRCVLVQVGVWLGPLPTLVLVLVVVVVHVGMAVANRLVVVPELLRVRGRPAAEG